MKPVIGIVQRVDHYPDRDEVRDALDQKLTTLLLQADVFPVPIPNVLGDTVQIKALYSWLHAIKPTGFVLSGGGSPGSDPNRDSLESSILNFAEEYTVPVLGICRGMQILASRFGASLVPVVNHVRTRHQLTGLIEQSVNSFHDFAIDRIPDGFSILATSEDGTIEAIRHHTLPWEGWMWHPERELEFSKVDIKRITNLFR